MKKKDFILIISLIVIAGIVFLIYNFSGETGETVIISKDNKIIETLSLFEDKIIDIGSNTIEIKESKVSVINGNCHNQICVNHKPISKKGESIVCLPNKVIVEIE